MIIEPALASASASASLVCREPEVQMRVVHASQADKRGWDQLYLMQVRCIDCAADGGEEELLVSVAPNYEELPNQYPEDVPAARRLHRSRPIAPPANPSQPFPRTDACHLRGAH